MATSSLYKTFVIDSKQEANALVSLLTESKPSVETSLPLPHSVEMTDKRMKELITARLARAK